MRPCLQSSGAMSIGKHARSYCAINYIAYADTLKKANFFFIKHEEKKEIKKKKRVNHTNQKEYIDVMRNI